MITDNESLDSVNQTNSWPISKSIGVENRHCSSSRCRELEKYIFHFNWIALQLRVSAPAAPQSMMYRVHPSICSITPGKELKFRPVYGHFSARFSFLRSNDGLLRLPVSAWPGQAYPVYLRCHERNEKILEDDPVMRYEFQLFGIFL